MSDRIDPNLLREYADGELPAERASAVSARLQDDAAAAQAGRAQVMMERQLRERVRQVMGEPCAPSSVKQGVAQAMAAERAAAADRATEPVARVDADGVRMRRPMSRWRSVFASPQRANALAIAAVLALISSVVLYGIFAPTIDETQQRGPSASDLVANAAEYADGQHGECTVNAERLQSKAEWLTQDAANIHLTDNLNTPVEVFDLSSLGYEFVGAGPSGLPFERVPSGHLIYKKTNARGQTAGMVSVFVAPTTGCCKKMCAKMPRGEWRNACESDRRLTHRVLYSTDRKLIYFLVCCDENDLEPVASLIAQHAPKD